MDREREERDRRLEAEHLQEMEEIERRREADHQKHF